MKTYSELLYSPEWFKRRDEIINNADRKCQECGRCQVGCESCNDQTITN